MEDVFQCHLVIDEVLGEIRQSLDLFGGLVTAAGDEPLDVNHSSGQSGQRRIQIGAAALQHGRHVGKTVLELDNLGVAVAQHCHEGLQILDDFHDVPAAVGQRAAQPGELFDRLPQFGAVALHRVGGTVYEATDRGCVGGAVTVGAQIR